MTNNLQFYPTPAALANKMRAMLGKIEFPLLEPSAGNGDLLENFFSQRTLKSEIIHCVELHAKRAATLRGNGYKVVHNDFLTFNPVTPYRTIIMNPPFNNGALHLLKAISIAAPDAQICCILNAETIKNPFSRERKLLIKTLERQADYKCEFVTDAFNGVNVEVAIVYVKTQPPKSKSICLEHFKRSTVRENKYRSTELQPADEIAALVARYRVEVKSAFALYDEIENYRHAVLFGDKYEHDAFEIKLPYGGKIEVLRRINLKYWDKLFGCESIQHLLTNAARHDLSEQIYDMRDFEFNEYNINNLKIELCKNLTASIDDAILKMWNDFTHRFSTENPENIHYYNGWKTNKAFKCNGKVIIPLYLFDELAKASRSIANYNVVYPFDGQLADYEKALNYLDTGAVVSYNMQQTLNEAARQNQTRGIDTHFFKVDCFKKGTVHLTFKSAELLKKFNLYCGRKFNWLPPSYGKKPYRDLTPDEKAVADSFEGEQSYNDTFANQTFYLADTPQLLLT